MIFFLNVLDLSTPREGWAFFGIIVACLFTLLVLMIIFGGVLEYDLLEKIFDPKAKDRRQTWRDIIASTQDPNTKELWADYFIT